MHICIITEKSASMAALLEELHLTNYLTKYSIMFLTFAARGATNPLPAGKLLLPNNLRTSWSVLITLVTCVY